MSTDILFVIGTLVVFSFVTAWKVITLDLRIERLEKDRAIWYGDIISRD